MKNSKIIIKNDEGNEFLIKIISENENYGLNDSLTHDNVDPLVEFYDYEYSIARGNNKFGEDGQFVSRYYLSTLLANRENEDKGICLDGGIPKWNIDSDSMSLVVDWLEEIRDKIENYEPFDKLSGRLSKFGVR